MTIDYTRNEIDVLIDLIRDDNNRRTLTTGQATFGRPNVFTPVPNVDRNTVVIATAIADRGYSGSQKFYYNRQPLQKFVPGDDPDVLTFPQGTATKLSQLLPELNRRLNIKLTPEKIVEQTLPVFTNDDHHDTAEVVLSMQSDSLVYINQLTLVIKRPTQLLINAIPDPDMDGLYYAPPPLT